MRIISLNVNNFGGLISKPLIKDYSYDGKPSWADWNNAVITWRKENQWENNVAGIVNHVRNFDIIVLQEVDTNSEAFKELIKQLYEYSVVYPNETNEDDFCKGYKSITIMFIKKCVDYAVVTENFSTKKMKNVEVTIDNKNIIGLHISMADIDYWDSLIKRYKELKDKKVLIIGDMNVYDWGTQQKEKFFELLKCGAVDAWVEKGNSMHRPTANTEKRIDYAIISPLFYEELGNITIDDVLRNKAISDHSAISISI
ncbi:exodeoxyribonuclease III (xth) [Clostridium putrefaciens]|uniref:Exodeoxyribonuclease III (Xth) n=1 Tax=Clostridium putrefaciens TaxID=99675 RepID=A0A381J9J4_9CLOT|nr:endonuclease/exonuclease/phosphatase family protein [Clostridium putrefaciens]SUY47683.1 exodeoxyribonuclease III (xth) [Clostridium putrefaciens]